MQPILVRHRFAPLRETPRQLIVMLHGYGANADGMLALPPVWQPLLSACAIILPSAPEPVPGWPDGSVCWFSMPAQTPDILQKGVEGVAAALDRFLDAELAHYGLPPKRLILVGFSQGAMMALDVGLRRAVPPAAIVSYSGILPAPPPPKGERAPAILLVHGDADDVVPVSRLAEAATALTASGYAVQSHVTPNMGHDMDQASILLGAQFAHRVLKQNRRAKRLGS